MAETCNWLAHTFSVYEPATTTWSEASGVYIFAEFTARGWVPHYIGQATSFADRLPNHEQWGPAVRLGATHIHAMAVTSQAMRDVIERVLITHFSPTLNTQHRQ